LDQTDLQQRYSQPDMSPPSATSPPAGDAAKPSTAAPHEPGLNEKDAKAKVMSFPNPPTFEDKYKERAYLKGRLAAAFRIFGKYGYDEGVAGHITMRVCYNVERVAGGKLSLTNDRTQLILRLSG
jgi:hypothetical protein